MALIPKQGAIPHGGEVLTHSSAITSQKGLIHSWTPVSEIWPLKYGNYILGVASGICGMYINNCFRRRLQMRQIGAFLSYTALGVAPGVMAAVLHTEHVTNRILLYKTGCTVCLETQASLYQSCITTLYPLTMAPILNLGIAASNGYRVPHISEIKEIAKFWMMVVKPVIPVLSGIVAFNMLFAGYITYKEVLSMNTVQQILLCIEESYLLKQSETLNNE